MLGDGRDDGDVDFGVARIPERIEAAGPGRDGARDREQDEEAEGYEEDGQDGEAEERVELLARHLGADVFGESNELEETEDACRDISRGPVQAPRRGLPSALI